MKLFIVKKKKLIIIGLILIIIIFATTTITISKDIPSFASYECSDNEERIKYLSSFGWIVQKEPFECKIIIIPIEFNSTYKRYNELQLSQGFDLTQYKGETVRRFTYIIQNYPKEGIAYASLYVLNNKIIAGDVYTSGLNGIMHGLNYPNIKAG